MEEKRETVGKISSDLLQKTPDSRDPIEIQRAMQENYINSLMECVQTHTKKFSKDFFIVVITKNEKLMPNVFRNYFAARLTCPTPDYDQTVWRYSRQHEHLEYIWTIPSKDACIHLKNNALLVSPEEQGILDFVLKFSDGTLYKFAKQLNGESYHAPQLIA